MKRVLVTGAEGFTGRYLTAALAAVGHEVHGLVRPAPTNGEAASAAHARHVCDLSDADGLSRVVDDVRPDCIVHLAAIAFVAHDNVDDMYRTNIVGARNLLAAAARRPPSLALLASSANVYGNASGGVIDESVAPAPANDYAVSKLAMERMASLWHDRLPITIVRPFNYTGVGQSTSFLIPKIVDHFRRRASVIELGNLDVERDFSDVRVVVDCYRRLIEAPCTGATLNVCSGHGTTLREVLAMCSELTGHPLEVRVNPAFVRPNEVRRLVGNCSALEAAIGPVRRVALRETLEWMLGA